MSEILSRAGSFLAEHRAYLNKETKFLQDMYSNHSVEVSKLASAVEELEELNIRLLNPSVNGTTYDLANGFSKYEDLLNELSKKRTQCTTGLGLFKQFSHLLKVEASLSSGEITEKTAFESTNKIISEYTDLAHKNNGVELLVDADQITEIFGQLMEEEQSSLNRDNDLTYNGGNSGEIVWDNKNEATDSLEAEYMRIQDRHNELKEQLKGFGGDFELNEEEVEELERVKRGLSDVCTRLQDNNLYKIDDEIGGLRRKIEDLTNGIYNRSRLSSVNSNEDVSGFISSVFSAYKEAGGLYDKYTSAYFEDKSRIGLDMGESISQFGEKTPANFSSSALSEYNNMLENIDASVEYLKTQGIDTAKAEEQFNKMKQQNQELQLALQTGLKNQN